MEFVNKKIFCFSMPDQSVRYEDPLLILRGLTLTTKGRLDELVDKQSIIDTDNPIDPVIQAEAEDRLITAIRQTFGFKPIDQTTGFGIDDEFCLNVLRQFRDFLEAKKANTVN